MANYRSSTIRRVHALLGVISAVNLLLLISTGLLIQHMNALRLDERTVSRRWLPANYRPQDGSEGVRADIVITDLHSGRIIGTAGTVILDVVTMAWLVLLSTGVVMYAAKGNNGRKDPFRNGGEGGKTKLAKPGGDGGKHASARAGSMAQSCVAPEPGPPSYILRCCPALCPFAGRNVAVMHLTDVELKGALYALERLWTGRTAARPLSKTAFVAGAYRCRDGHCHLLCQCASDLCRTEQSALVLFEVMAEAAGVKPGSEVVRPPIGAQPENKPGQVV